MSHLRTYVGVSYYDNRDDHLKRAGASVFLFICCYRIYLQWEFSLEAWTPYTNNTCAMCCCSRVRVSHCMWASSAQQTQNMASDASSLKVFSLVWHSCGRPAVCWEISIWQVVTAHVLLVGMVCVGPEGSSPRSPQMWEIPCLVHHRVSLSLARSSESRLLCMSSTLASFLSRWTNRDRH